MSPAPTDDKLASAAIEITTDASQALPKVQLDIDDAPFLREKEPEAPPRPPKKIEEADEALPTDPKPTEDTGPSKKKKRIIIIASALLALLLAGGGGATWWFVLRTPPPAPQVVVVPSPATDSAQADFLIPLAPFWLELASSSVRHKDQIFFLVCKFTAIAKSEDVVQEAQNKIIVIRDALYFYLRNKDLEFLTSPDNTQTVKDDLISVINGYLALGEVDDMLFERYITK